MRLFWEIVQRGIQRQIAYRAVMLAGLGTNFFFGILRAAILMGLYGDRTIMAGLSRSDALTYIAFTQAVIAYLSLFGWYEVANQVYNGEISADLLKPLSYQFFWFGRDFGQALVNFVVRGIVIFIGFALFYPMSYPQTALRWLLVVLALLLAWLVSFGWRFLINLSAFWLGDARGLLRVVFAASWFLSGFWQPLRFYPAALRQAAYTFTPFPYLLDAVFEVFSGVLTVPQTLQILLQQAAWSMGLLLLGQFIMRRGVRKLVIVGG
ncbi:MAG: ABC-2 family transporter protein [Anaerolineales bacterium]